MKDEYDQLLCQRYPLIFAERTLPMTVTCMCWGFDCGDGWFHLIDTLCERLQFLTERRGAPQITARQVKEKFGALRFYTSGTANPEQLGMIQMVEALSARTCDQCGKPGQTLVLDHFFLTRCSDHAPEGSVTAIKYCEQRGVPGIAP